MHTNGKPVAGSLRTRTAEARGRPLAVFPGKLEIHLMPSTSGVDAGSAMIRAVGRSGNRRKYDGGLTVAPVPWAR
ncbi:hypothetical protein GCM10029964_078350 [Kibdelosporangium lantanae]